MLLFPCHLNSLVSKYASGHDGLLHQVHEQHYLQIKISQQKVAGRCPERVWTASTYHVVLISCKLISCALGPLRLAAPALLEHMSMRRIVRVNSLHECFDWG